MKSNKEIYADVYIAGLRAFLDHVPQESRSCTMPNARDSAEKTLREFRDLVGTFPECNDPVPPSDLDTNPEAGKF